ncbi:MAG: addiction module protein [Nitrospirae bacterium]|nr:addiction module protein [Nitrospirota bacterium]
MRKAVGRLEAETLKLDPKGRARLAGKLIESLETLSDAENADLWLEEAERRDAELDDKPDLARTSNEVLRNARSK